jgi:T5SS/PEP-CTERM-associated repeat protein/autotransporter-associated beta strand protein
LSGTNTHTGGTTITGGTLSLEGGAALADTGAVVVNDGGTLNLAASETIGSLAGAGSVSLNANTLTTGGNNASTTYSGVMSASFDPGTGLVRGLTKTGTGTFTLTGANTYSSNTTVKAGTLTVSGTGRINGYHMTVGEASGDDGTLVIANGGAVSSTVSRIGYTSSIGTGTITGAGSTWNASNLYVGDRSGTGTLTIENGGKLNSSIRAFIGSDGGTGTVTVTGANSTWNANSQIYVGDDSGTGTLTIADGGAVSSNSNDVRIGVNGVGTVTVSGADSTLTTAGGDLYVGYINGTGTLNIGNYDLSAPDVAGTVTAYRLTTNTGSGTVNFNQTDATTFATPIQGNITVNQRGSGTTTLSGTNTYTGTTTVSGGTLAVDGAITSATTVNSGATLGGSGSVTGTVTVAAGATIAPGNSAGTLTVSELLLDDTSVLNVELGDPAGTAGTDSDLIVVKGNLILDGVLNITDLGSFGLGTYRLIDYTGTLTDHGLRLGTVPLPAGHTAALDISNTGRVDLVVSLLTYPVTTAVNPTIAGTLACTPNPVPHGSASTCTLTPAAGFRAADAVDGTCPTGTWQDASTYHTEAITAACSLSFAFVLDGACGTADDTPSLTAPATGLCAFGSSGPVTSADGAHAWTCTGDFGGSDAQCSAPGAALAGHPGNTVTLTTAGSHGCTLDSALLIDPPGGLPAGVELPYGAVEFTLSGCASATVTLTHSGPVDTLAFWKHIHGRWIDRMPATLSGHQVQFTLTDGSDWDSDPRPGFIADPGGVGTALAAVPVPVPALGPWALALLAGLRGALGLRRRLQAEPTAAIRWRTP